MDFSVIDQRIHAVDPYAVIAEWWGEPLSVELIKRVEKAPIRHLKLFWAFAKTHRPSEFPDLPHGRLRPAVMNDGYYDEGIGAHYATALNLLLYTHEVTVSFLDRVDPRDLAPYLKVLLELKPLADQGILTFIGTGRMAHHPSFALVPYMVFDDHRVAPGSWSRFTASVDRARERGTFAYAELDTPRAYETALFHFQNSTGLTLQLARRWPSRFQLLSRSDAEQVLLEEYASAMGRESSDLRGVSVRKVASLAVPNLSLKIGALVELRKNEEIFGAWRDGVAQAVAAVQDMPDRDEQWAAQAREVIAGELDPLKSRLEKAVKKSAVLSAAKTNLKALMFSGLGAGMGTIAGGNFAASAIGAGAGKVAEFTTNYVTALQGRRRNKAVLDLLMTFSEQ